MLVLETGMASVSGETSDQEGLSCPQRDCRSAAKHQAYRDLANDSWERFQQSRGREELNKTIALQRSTLDFLPVSHPDCSDSLSSLALYLRERYDRWWQMEDLDEAIALNRATLNLRPEGHLDRSDSLANLASCLDSRYRECGQTEDLEESICLQRTALTLRPEGHASRSCSLADLSISLRARYRKRGREEDLEESIELGRAALILHPEGHPSRSRSFYDLSVSLRARYRRRGQEEDLEESIELGRAALAICSEGHPDRPHSLAGLASSLFTRYQRTGRAEDLEESIRLNHDSLALRPEGHPSRSDSLANLASSLTVRYQRCGQVEDLKKSIELDRSALSLRSEGHPNRHHSLINLAYSLHAKYQKGGRTEELEESIELGRVALALCPEGHPDRSMLLNRLTCSLFSRFEQFGFKRDFEECMQLLGQAAGHKFSSTLVRLEAARQWASLARSHNYNTTLRAYKEALLLLQQALTISPTLHAQHDFLVRNQDQGTLAVEAASYAIEKNELGQAVELLEQGRALLWSQMRGFRTPIDQLVESSRELADRFRNVNHQLEEVAMSSATLFSGSNVPRSYNVQESIDKVLARQRKLIEDQERLVAEIRQVPGFENFLRTAPLETLLQVASEGPVIMINHCKFRSDALIILPAGDHPPILCVPLDKEFNRHASNLCHELVETRILNKPDSSEYNEKLQDSMKMLWDRVVSKVIRKLKELDFIEGSRIWWCPTSTLSVLPFHAAGPYLGTDGMMKYLLDDYISSYTPTLGALLNTRAKVSRLEPNLLIVGDTTLLSAKREVSIIRSCGLSNSQLIGNRALHNVVMEGLQKTKWVHFACHGHLGTRPFDSSFKLFDRGLTLLDIIQADIPNAEFAFLSACHTAEQPHVVAHDEVLHLAAAMQFSGFRSVIGTMWELYDPDGPTLARDVYAHLLQGEEGEVMYKRAAAALRRAVVNLKAEEGIQTERWVNMIHIGA